MSIKGKANIVGIFEHPTRKADDKSLFQLHAECAAGALADAGLTKDDIDGYFCASGDTPGLGALSMIDYLGLKTAPLGFRPIPAARRTSCRSATPPRRLPRANAGWR